MSSLVLTTKVPRTNPTQDGVGFWRGLAILDLVLIVAWISIVSVILARGSESVAHLAPHFLMFLAMILSFPAALSQMQRARCSTNCEITLDDRGLFYACGAKMFTWSWQDLSQFEVRAAKPFRSWIGVSYVRIALRNDGAIKRFLRSWREPRIIVDAYGTSLDEIAAKLNEYRERALGGASAIASG